MTEHAQVHAAHAGTVIRMPAWKEDGVWCCTDRNVLAWYITRNTNPHKPELTINPITQEGVWYRTKWPFVIGLRDYRTAWVSYELTHWDGTVWGRGRQEDADAFLLQDLERFGLLESRPWSPKRDILHSRQTTPTEDENAQD